MLATALHTMRIRYHKRQNTPKVKGHSIIFAHKGYCLATNDTVHACMYIYAHIAVIAPCAEQLSNERLVGDSGGGACNHAIETSGRALPTERLKSSCIYTYMGHACTCIYTLVCVLYMCMGGACTYFFLNEK